jgi:hypothetical protein
LRLGGGVRHREPRFRDKLKAISVTFREIREADATHAPTSSKDTQDQDFRDLLATVDGRKLAAGFQKRQ